MHSRRKLIFLLAFVISSAFILGLFQLNDASAVFIDAKDVSPEETNPTGLAFNADGTKMFVMGRAVISNVNEYACTTGFDVSTCGFTVKYGNPF